MDQRSGDGQISGRSYDSAVDRRQLIEGRDFPDFEMLDAKIASALKRISSNQYFRRRIHVEDQNAKKYDRFLRGRQIAYMIYDHFRVTGAYDTVLDYTDLLSVTRFTIYVKDSIR